LRGEPVAGGVPRVAGGRGCDGAEPDADGVWGADGGGREVGAERRAEAAAGDLRGRAAGVRDPEALDGEARGGEATAGEHVRDHRDDGARELPAGGGGGG